MGEVVNLNKYRKKKAREEREKRAEQNRLKRGLSQAELALREKKKQIEDKRLDGHKLEARDERDKLEPRDEREGGRGHEASVESIHKLDRDET
jgi:hypothetical protein